MSCLREHSSLGNHSADFENFKGSQTLSLASPSKFSKNSKSTTANIRMLFSWCEVESLDSRLDSGVESALESNQSIDSTIKSRLDSRVFNTLKPSLDIKFSNVKISNSLESSSLFFRKV